MSDGNSVTITWDKEGVTFTTNDGKRDFWSWARVRETKKDFDAAPPPTEHTEEDA